VNRTPHPPYSEAKYFYYIGNIRDAAGPPQHSPQHLTWSETPSAATPGSSHPAGGGRRAACWVPLQANLQASADPSELGPQDDLIITVKAASLPKTASQIGPLLGSRTAVVTAMNGVPWYSGHSAFDRSIEPVCVPCRRARSDVGTVPSSPRRSRNVAVQVCGPLSRGQRQR
jgi:hypothetical protein